jgi:hypothetical protein
MLSNALPLQVFLAIDMGETGCMMQSLFRPPISLLVKEKFKCVS